MSNWWSGHKMVESSELEGRYANEDGMAFMDQIVNEEVTEEGAVQMERVRAVMEQLPPREADFIDLYYFKKAKQTDIAVIFGVSQPTVCYRLQRAATRIHFLLTLPEVDGEDVERTSKSFLTDPLDVQIMVLMQQTTCQSEVAKRLGVTQGFVRHRFIRSLTKMRVSEEAAPVVLMFDLIAANLNILREVQRPVWDTRVARVLAG